MPNPELSQRIRALPEELLGLEREPGTAECLRRIDALKGRARALEPLDGVEEMLKKLIPLYEEQDKNILRICFGCTGGRHRSVAAAEEMARRFVDSGMNVRIYHRDLTTEAADIHERFENG